MEVALAATVLALTLVGMIGAVDAGTQMLDLSRKGTIAEQLLHSEMDFLRTESWQTISGYNGTQAVLGQGLPSTATLTSGGDAAFAIFAANYPNASSLFTLTRTVTCVEPSQANNNPFSSYAAAPLLIQVTFTIQWNGVTGRKYSRSSTTLIGKNGLSDVYQKS
jgi:hypothetical protein